LAKKVNVLMLKAGDRHIYHCFKGFRKEWRLKMVFGTVGVIQEETVALWKK
jgi:ribosomal protein L23